MWLATVFCGKARHRDVGVKPMSDVATQSQESVVGLGGLEPPASPLSGVRSNHLSYRPNALIPRNPREPQTGGACRDRTDDPLLAKQVLSQLSYGPVCSGRSHNIGRTAAWRWEL